MLDCYDRTISDYLVGRAPGDGAKRIYIISWPKGAERAFIGKRCDRNALRIRLNNAFDTRRVAPACE